MAIAFVASQAFQTNSYIKICSKLKECILEGKLSFAFSDSGLKGGFEMKEIDNE